MERGCPEHVALFFGQEYRALVPREYRAFARECLEMAEKAVCADLRLRLIELSRQWMRAAIAEEPQEMTRTPRIALWQGKAGIKPSYRLAGP